MYYLVLCLFFCFNLIQSKLLYVIELNRHGARTATNYHQGPLSSFFGENMKLTPNGFRQHQLLGQFIRNKYITNLHFLNEEYNHNQLEIISTQTQRTIFSAEGFLSGLYPGAIAKIIYDSPNINLITNDTIPVFNLKQLQLTEIDIKVIDMKKDVLFHALSCELKGKRLKKEMKKAIPGSVFNITEQDIEQSMNEITDFLNITINRNVSLPSHNKITEIQKLFFVNSYHLGRDWNLLSHSGLLLMRKLVLNKWYSTRTKDSIYLRLSVSALFETIISKFEGARKKQNFLRNTDHKLYSVYSTHDSTIVSVLTSLYSYEVIKELLEKSLKNEEIFNFLVPPFASSMIFELHSDEMTGEKYVMFFYNGKVIDQDLQTIPNEKISKNRIPYEDFKELLQSKIEMSYKNIDCSNIANEEKEKNKDDLFITPPILK